MLYAIGRGFSLDSSLRIWWTVYNYTIHPPDTSSIPYLSFLTRLLRAHSIPTFPNEPRSMYRREISRVSESASLARIGEVRGPGLEVSNYPPPYPALIPEFPALFPAPSYRPPWRVVPLSPEDVRDDPAPAAVPEAAQIPSPVDAMMEFLQL